MVMKKLTAILTILCLRSEIACGERYRSIARVPKLPPFLACRLSFDQTSTRHASATLLALSQLQAQHNRTPPQLDNRYHLHSIASNFVKS